MSRRPPDDGRGWDPSNGLGLSGQMRLERIEMNVDRTNDKLDRLGNELHDAVQGLKDLPGRVRALEFKFYGILAGLITAIGILIYNRSQGL